MFNIEGTFTWNIIIYKNDDKGAIYKVFCSYGQGDYDSDLSRRQISQVPARGRTRKVVGMLAYLW